jgi:hypothetical protein
MSVYYCHKCQRHIDYDFKDECIAPASMLESEGWRCELFDTDEPEEPMKLSDVADNLYGSEINFGIQSFWDGGWEAWLGDQMNGRKCQEINLKWDEIPKWLHDNALVQFPESDYAKHHA